MPQPGDSLRAKREQLLRRITALESAPKPHPPGIITLIAELKKQLATHDKFEAREKQTGRAGKQGEGGSGAAEPVPSPSSADEKRSSYPDSKRLSSDTVRWAVVSIAALTIIGFAAAGIWFIHHRIEIAGLEQHVAAEARRYDLGANDWITHEESGPALGNPNPADCADVTSFPYRTYTATEKKTYKSIPGSNVLLVLTEWKKPCYKTILYGVRWRYSLLLDKLQIGGPAEGEPAEDWLTFDRNERYSDSKDLGANDWIVHKGSAPPPARFVEPLDASHLRLPCADMTFPYKTFFPIRDTTFHHYWKILLKEGVVLELHFGDNCYSPVESEWRYSPSLNIIQIKTSVWGEGNIFPGSWVNLVEQN